MSIRTTCTDGIIKAEYRGEFWDEYDLSSEMFHNRMDIWNNALDGLELKGAQIVIAELTASLAALHKARAQAEP